MSEHPREQGWAAVILVVVTLLWGLSFPWTKTWQLAAVDCPGGEVLSTLTLIGLRMPLAVLLLSLWQPRLAWAPSWREHGAGALIGAVFFAGFFLQTWGLARTTPALSAFFTSLCSAWVPVLGWLLLGHRVAALTLAGLGVGLAGCAVLVEGGWKLGAGEGLTLVASVLFAAQLLLLDRLGRWLEPGHFTIGFLSITGLLAALGMGVVATGVGVGAWGRWVAQMLARGEVSRSLACQVVLPTVLAFHWMNTYQPRVPASRAALIYLLEPVFTSVFSLAVGYDEVSRSLLVGGGLILAGNALAEVPGWWRGGRRPAGRDTCPRNSPSS